MTRLQSLITAFIAVALLLIVVSSVFAGKILLDGLGRYRTKLAFDYAYVVLPTPMGIEPQRTRRMPRFQRLCALRALCGTVFPSQLGRAAYVSLRRGNMLEASQGLMNATQMTIESGMRWQVASYLLKRTSQLRSEGQLLEAVKTCWAASDALGGYDPKNEVYRECMDLFWEERGY